MDLKTLSPAFLGVTLYDILNQPVTPHYAMLEEIKNIFPAFKHNMIIDATDNIKTTDLTEEEQALLEDYKMIQYDMLKGQQYSQELFFQLPTSETIDTSETNEITDTVDTTTEE